MEVLDDFLKLRAISCKGARVGPSTFLCQVSFAVNSFFHSEKAQSIEDIILDAEPTVVFKSKMQCPGFNVNALYVCILLKASKVFFFRFTWH